MGEVVGMGMVELDLVMSKLRLLLRLGESRRSPCFEVTMRVVGGSREVARRERAD